MRHRLAAVVFLLIACKDDPPPAEPGSAQAGEACQSEVPDDEQLCEADLVCYSGGATNYRGYCAPACEVSEDCEPVDGSPTDCFEGACAMMCDGPGEPCPKNYSVPLYCFGTHCARDTNASVD